MDNKFSLIPKLYMERMIREEDDIENIPMLSSVCDYDASPLRFNSSISLIYNSRNEQNCFGYNQGEINQFNVNIMIALNKERKLLIKYLNKIFNKITPNIEPLNYINEIVKFVGYDLKNIVKGYKIYHKCHLCQYR
jgi:hypothetical protein